MNAARYLYSYGHKTRDDAQDAIDRDISDGFLSSAERPRVETYRTRDGRRLYQITAVDTALEIYC